MEEKKMSFILERTQKAFDTLFYEYCKLKDAFLAMCPNTKFEFYQFGKERTRKINYWKEKYYSLAKEFVSLASKESLDEEDKKNIKKILKKLSLSVKS